MNIIVSGYAGLEGSILIYRDPVLRAGLLHRYPASFFEVFDGYAEILTKGDAGGDRGAGGDGGVLAALWRTLKSSNLGGVYELGKIPILQQTVEIADFFGINPYRLYSPSCEVRVREDMTEAAGIDIKKDRPCRVIGYTVPGPAITRLDSEAKSQLRRPSPDELTKLFGAGGGNRCRIKENYTAEE